MTFQWLKYIRKLTWALAWVSNGKKQPPGLAVVRLRAGSPGGPVPVSSLCGILLPASCYAGFCCLLLWSWVSPCPVLQLHPSGIAAAMLGTLQAGS